MVEFEGGKRIIVCNECCLEEKFPSLNYEKTILILAKKGWKRIKSCDEDVHYCPYCAK